MQVVRDTLVLLVLLQNVLCFDDETGHGRAGDQEPLESERASSEWKRVSAAFSRIKKVKTHARV